MGFYTDLCLTRNNQDFPPLTANETGLAIEY